MVSGTVGASAPSSFDIASRRERPSGSITCAVTRATSPYEATDFPALPITWIRTGTRISVILPLLMEDEAMAKYQLWDTPSATLLDETDDLASIVETVRSLIDDEGPDYLDELSLSEQLGNTEQFASYAGKDVLLSLQERLANMKAD
jgi:hypothetical protein